MRALFYSFILGLFAFSANAQEVEQTPIDHPLFEIQEADKVLGDKNAPVTIVEYSSLSCPHCAAFHNAVLPELSEKYIKTGKVNVVARPFPLNGPALAASKVLACLKGAEYHKFQEVFFKLQEKWAFAADFEDRLKQISQVGGMDAETFDACLADEATETAILEARQVAQEELIVRSTPTFFVNGEKVVGTGTIDSFSEVIDRKLDAEE